MGSLNRKPSFLFSLLPSSKDLIPTRKEDIISRGLFSSCLESFSISAEKTHKEPSCWRPSPRAHETSRRDRQMCQQFSLCPSNGFEPGAQELSVLYSSHFVIFLGVAVLFICLQWFQSWVATCSLNLIRELCLPLVGWWYSNCSRNMREIVTKTGNWKQF